MSDSNREESMVDHQQEQLKGASLNSRREQPEDGEHGKETEDAETKGGGSTGTTAAEGKPSSRASSTAIDNSSSVMTDTVYIGNIPLQYATEVVVEKLLQPHGPLRRVSVQHRQKPSTSTAIHTAQQQPSRALTHAFAFGQLESPIQAAAAIKALDGRKLGGQRLVVRPANSNRGEDGGRPTASFSKTASSSSQGRGVSQQKRQLDSRIAAIRLKLKQGNKEG